MAVRSVRVDPALEEGVTDARRREWAVLARDVTSELTEGDALFPESTATEMWISMDDESFVLRGRGEEVERRVERARLEPLVREYLAVIEMLDDDFLPMQRAEVLDMAKRVVHDSAGQLLGELLPTMTEDLERRRRLFSLLVALSTDTTKKRMAHRHL